MAAPDVLALILRQTVAMERLADRLAPRGQFLEVSFNGETAGATKSLRLGKGSNINKLAHALATGKIYVYLDSDPGNNNTPPNPDFILDANLPGPDHLPNRQVSQIYFRVAPGSQAARGKCRVETY